MKIKELWIEEYKILEDFTITFDTQLTVMIGENGAGKSTIIEVIANIFYDLYSHFVLDKGSKPDVDFKLRYDIEYEKIIYSVYITANKRTKEYYEFQIKSNGKNSKKYSKAEINNDFQNGYKDILPQNVVMYYSGISSLLLEKFESFQNDNILGSLDGDVKIEQPFFYFLPQNLSTILIGLLSYQYGDIPETLKSQFGISEFTNIKIDIKKPSWGKSPVSDNFWGSRGDLKVFLEKLMEACSTKIIEENKISFIFNTKEELEKIWSFYSEEKHLFQYLTTLQANGLIENIDVNLIHKGKEISFEMLSEGEKQFLILYGLKELLITENSLFLLDEPDTYLHPEWQRDLIPILKKSEMKSKTQFIITTHSPQVLSSLHENDVHILDGGKLYSLDSNGLFGRDTNSILEEVMGASEMSIEAKQSIENFSNAIALKNTNDANKFLLELKKHLSQDDPFFTIAEMRIERIERKSK